MIIIINKEGPFFAMLEFLSFFFPFPLISKRQKDIAK